MWSLVHDSCKPLAALQTGSLTFCAASVAGSMVAAPSRDAAHVRTLHQPYVFAKAHLSCSVLACLTFPSDRHLGPANLRCGSYAKARREREEDRYVGRSGPCSCRSRERDAIDSPRMCLMTGMCMAVQIIPTAGGRFYALGAFENGNLVLFDGSSGVALADTNMSTDPGTRAAVGDPEHSIAGGSRVVTILLNGQALVFPFVLCSTVHGRGQ